jgi:two-component sensor histidine kinase/DNA-binding response OmpR family regulator
MMQNDPVNVLLVDDQPAKLLSYEVILRELGENLIKAASAREALEQLLKNDVAVVLIDVCMPELDGFQLAAMIRDHPRFQKVAIIFISAIHLSDMDRLRGYQMGAVDYVPVPVIPEVLRAKVRIFAELYRKTRQLEQLNQELERRVAERTAELEASHTRLLESERCRSLALEAGQMGSWDWDARTDECRWDAGQYRILGVDPASVKPTLEKLQSFAHPEDVKQIEKVLDPEKAAKQTFQNELRIIRPNGQVRSCICAAALTTDGQGRIVRVSGVTIDITELKEAEERRILLVREVDHRARNALAVVQSIVRLTKAKTIDSYVTAVEGRIRALSTAHALLSESRWEGADLRSLVEEEIAPYRGAGEGERIVVTGPSVFLQPAKAQILALVLHELATNAAKYGALSSPTGRIRLIWECCADMLVLKWEEVGGPPVAMPIAHGYGTRVITASVERQMGGSAAFDWQVDGLSFTMSVPLRDRARTSEEFNADRSGKEKSDPVRYLTGNRVLLIEDEALVGMMMKETLNEFGFEVLGPYASFAEAKAAVTEHDFQAAILDVNLDGQPVYPLAEMVAGRGVPFVFVTGYSADGIDSRFRHIPILQKPIERAQLQRIFAPRGNGQLRAAAVPSLWPELAPAAVEPRRASRGSVAEAS